MDIFEEYIKEHKRDKHCRALTCKSYSEIYKKQYHEELGSTEKNDDLATYGDALLKFVLCGILLDKAEKLSEEKQQYETDRFLIETVARHYNLLDYINFDRGDEKILQKYKHYENDKTKYIATTVEAVLGAIYLANQDLESICELVNRWMSWRKL